MCEFFSCVSDGKGKVFYFDWELRKKCLTGELNYNPDSHTSIADYFGYKGAAEDSLNKYEFNPLTQNFTVDQINTTNDSAKVERWLKKIDWKTIAPQLIVKPIVNPFKIQPPVIDDKIIGLVREWGKVRSSVKSSVRDSVWDSVGDSVGDPVWNSVWDSVGNSVGEAVLDSVGDSVGEAVRYSIGYPVWNSVRAYASSFFFIENWKNIKHKKGENPFQPAIDLWEMGLVLSFDGEIWRLHGGEKGEILWEEND